MSIPHTVTSSASPGLRATVSHPWGVNPALQLAQQGWYCERDFFDADEVRVLRTAIAAALDDPAHQSLLLKPPGCGEVLPDLFRLPALYRRVFTARMAALLSRLIGEGLVLLPEHAAHRNGFGGWHKDTNMFEAAGSMAHWSSDYAVYQCGIYLQDNSPESGGGLSVVPGSHRVPRNPAQTEVVAQQHGVVLDSRAGDLVVFHTRLDHRATPAQGQPPYGDKLALFFMAAQDNQHAAAYCEFIHRRKDYTYLRTYRTPDDLQTLARAQGIRFAD